MSITTNPRNFNMADMSAEALMLKYRADFDPKW